MVVHTCDFGTREAEAGRQGAGGLWGLASEWLGHPGLEFCKIETGARL